MERDGEAMTRLSLIIDILLAIAFLALAVRLALK